MIRHIFFAVAVVFFFSQSIQSAAARQGCCSWHGGINSCGSDGYYMCNDGTRSPSCTCSGGAPSTTTNSIKYTSPEDEVEYFKMVNTPSNTTASCRSRFGEGSITGLTQCECIGGYAWNSERTVCVKEVINSYLKDAPESSSERLRMRVKSLKTNIQSSSSSSSSSSSNKNRIEKITQCRGNKAKVCLCSSGYEPKIAGGKQVCAK